ncbi:MAG TPA: tRNA preQ1(34) S-adenosylmethionine ribosyltransferase-isomerase QueA [archaeon]|nr:tRNA preQ1(34) S-adenosylmethionine ribosyltransferase-isomerase QueA [archaeon]
MPVTPLKNKILKTADFTYNLPGALVAQHPASRRDASRLMIVHRQSGRLEHRMFTDLPQYVEPGDLLVLNNTRVFPARLTGNFSTGGAFEVLLVRKLEGARWLALVKPGRKIRPGRRLEAGLLSVQIEDFSGTGVGGERLVRLEAPGSDDPEGLDKIIEKCGHVPLPPYISRPDTDEDRVRYQTIYAQVTGAIAAPTAGLHFTPEVMQAVREAGAGFAELTLHVGPGTFRPVVAGNPAEHKMGEEYYEVKAETLERMVRAKREGGGIIAVGTTAVRALETVAAGPGGLERLGEEPARGWTGLFIYPGHSFRLVDRLLTNFHLPRSTLLMLVSAFAGRELILDAYREAVARKYRFYSYGDAMLIL